MREIGVERLPPCLGVRNGLAGCPASRGLKNAAIRLSQALGKRCHGKSFSEHFQSLQLAEDRPTLTGSSVDRETASDNRESLTTVAKLPPDQGLEFLLDTFRDYCQNHPEQAVRLRESIIQMTGLGLKVIEVENEMPSSFQPAAGNSSPPCTSLQANPFGPEDAQSQALWSACLSAARLDSPGD